MIVVGLRLVVLRHSELQATALTIWQVNETVRSMSESSMKSNSGSPRPVGKRVETLPINQTQIMGFSAVIATSNATHIMNANIRKLTSMVVLKNLRQWNGVAALKTEIGNAPKGLNSNSDCPVAAIRCGRWRCPCRRLGRGDLHRFPEQTRLATTA